jgi:succinoglycan biosynthesis transport protein ExoP
MSLLQVLVILRARYKTVCLCLLGAAALVALVSQVLPRYTGETTVVVDLSVPDPVAGFVLAADSMSGYMPTQIAIVTSDHVAQKVVKSLGLVTRSPGSRTPCNSISASPWARKAT